jgi:hypothetical protein
VRRFLIFVAVSLLCSFAWSQTPTLVQSVWGENSLNYNSAGWPGNPPLYYAIEFPEPSQPGNLLVCSAFISQSPTLTISDDKGETWSTGGSNYPFKDSNNNSEFIWYMANNSGGVRQVKVNSTTNPGYASVTCSEFYNLATSNPLDGNGSCHNANGTTLAGTATGTVTSGDLIYFVSYGNAATSASFTAGSQSNISWALDAVDLIDGYAVQHGVYSATASFTPQMTAGTSGSYTSCEVMFKAASAGTAPTQTMRIVHLGHFSLPNSGTTQKIQMPSSGNLLVASFTAGGDSISGISSTPSNTWSSTGGAVSGGPSLNASAQIYYAANASTATSLIASVTRAGTLANDNLLIYDITGANTSPLDKDSGALSGTQSSQVSSFATCSSCLTPSSSGELVILNANQDWCTGTAVTAPSGALFDSAFTTMNSVNGAQPVDQNGEWAHLYNTGTSAISATWTMSCDEAELGWAGRAAAFTGAPQTKPLPPTGVQAAPVAQ